MQIERTFHIPASCSPVDAVLPSIRLGCLIVVTLTVHAVRKPSSASVTATFVERELQFGAAVGSIGQRSADAGDIARSWTRVVKVLEVGLVRCIFAEFGDAGSLGGVR